MISPFSPRPNGLEEIAFGGRAIADLEQFLHLPGKLGALNNYLTRFMSVPLELRVSELRAIGSGRSRDTIIVTTHPLIFVKNEAEFAIQILIKPGPEPHPVVMRLFLAPVYAG